MTNLIFTNGGKSKLNRYRALGVQEVWFGEDGLFTLYNLGADGYDRTNRSELVPQLDFDLLTGVRFDELDRARRQKSSIFFEGNAYGRAGLYES